MLNSTLQPPQKNMVEKRYGELCEENFIDFRPKVIARKKIPFALPIFRSIRLFVCAKSVGK